MKESGQIALVLSIAAFFLGSGTLVALWRWAVSHAVEHAKLHEKEEYLEEKVQGCQAVNSKIEEKLDETTEKLGDIKETIARIEGFLSTKLNGGKDIEAR